MFRHGAGSGILEMRGSRRSTMSAFRHDEESGIGEQPSWASFRGPHLVGIGSGKMTDLTVAGEGFGETGCCP